MMPGIASSGASSAAGVVATVVKTVFITATGTFTIPADFQSLVSVEAIGAGGNGTAGSSFIAGKGGPSGAYSQITALSGLAPSGSVYVRVGTPGSGDTWLNKTANSAPGSTTDGVLARGAASGPGTAASSVGSLKYDGGDDRSGSGNIGGGGAGAPGPDGAGVRGTIPAGGDGNNSVAGGGAGGATAGTAGGAGTYWTQTSDSATAGPGGGGAGGNAAVGAAAGNYGAGGGGGGKSGSNPAGGAGAPGIIVFTYNGT